MNAAVLKVLGYLATQTILKKNYAWLTNVTPNNLLEVAPCISVRQGLACESGKKEFNTFDCFDLYGVTFKKKKESSVG